MKNNIILVGMMGAGKSFIGNCLKNQFPQMSFVDIDDYIENQEKMTISEIFSTKGEPAFRDIETQVIKLVCQGDNQIISLGGGAFEREENRQILNSCGYTIYLKASADVLFERIKNETHRPLLKQGFGVEKIDEILQKRESNYQKAVIVVDTTEKSSYNIISEILKRIEEYAE